jgi:hypothetical protein
MNIATINEILFPFALFFGYFCLACLLVPKQQQAANPLPKLNAPSLPNLTQNHSHSPRWLFHLPKPGSTTPPHH